MKRISLLKASASLLVIVALCLPAFARLSSTKAQEATMVARAMKISEKWLRRLNDAYGKQDGYDEEIARLRKEIARDEGGILNEMAVATDMARLTVFSQYKDTKLFTALDDFDRAADALGTADRMRYYLAKARLRSGRTAPFVDSVLQEWSAGLTADCMRAARCGGETETCAELARAFAKNNKLADRLLDESLCRIVQESARWFVAEARRLRRAGNRGKALKLALQAVKTIEPLTVITDTAACTKWKSEGMLLARYDSLFVRPLCAAAGGKGGDEIRLRVADRYWEYRPLVAAVLVRVTTPSSDAFSLFKKAGKDERLMLDGRIAAAEMLLWKKAGRFKEFKKEFPERYGLAKRHADTGKKKRR